MCDVPTYVHKSSLKYTEILFIEDDIINLQNIT